MNMSLIFNSSPRLERKNKKMIKSNLGVSIIDGKMNDIVVDYTLIFKNLLESEPEIILGVHGYFANELHKALETADNDAVTAIIALLRNIA